MSTIRNQAIPVFSNRKGEAKTRELSYGKRNIFLPLQSPHNTNAKYMIRHDQFKTRNAPILRFFSSFDDRNELPRDQMKFRSCRILYYVEDGTIKVYEPIQRNAGFPQGYLVSRNKIPKADGEYYGLDDLNIGKTVTFYGKTFKILDCDPFTKNYLKEMGYRVGSPEPEAIDPVYADRLQLDTHHLLDKEVREVGNNSSNFRKFYPKCLHFYVIYNYKPSFLTDICYASLYYNIVDCTMKIVDEKKLLEYKKQLNMGNYDSYLILKPTLVPKKIHGLTPMGGHQHPIILNLYATSKKMHLQELMKCRSGGVNNRMAFLRDSNPVKLLDMCNNYYTVEDIDIGKTLDIFGTKVFFYDCDEFTKEFYRNEYGKELIPVQLPDIDKSKYHQLVYKQNFGDPDDSLQTCRDLPAVTMIRNVIDWYSLFQKPFHKGSMARNNIKIYLNCRNGLDGKVLKFLSKVATVDVFLKDQYFIIQFFLEDDTIQIYGLDIKFTTSNANNGAFLKRMVLAKPISEGTNAVICYYTPADLFVGNVIYAIKKPFVIIDADEYTYDYMERHCDTFPNSNIKDVLDKLFPVIRDKADELSNSFENIDLDKTRFVSYNDFRNILLRFLPEDIKNSFTEHQIKTVARRFGHQEYIGLKYDQLLSRIQFELKKKRFEDFDKLETLFRLFEVEDGNSNGLFEPDCVYKILRSYPLLIDRDLLKSFVFKFPKSNGLISYKGLVSALNYFDNPLKYPDHDPYVININWERIEIVKNINKIAYTLFLKELTIEKCSKCM